MVNNNGFFNYGEENKMAVRTETVNQMHNIFSLKKYITNIQLKVIEAMNTIEKTTSFDKNDLSDEEKLFLNTYKFMIDEQEDFAKNEAPISYKCILDDDDEEDYSDW